MEHRSKFAVDVKFEMSTEGGELLRLHKIKGVYLLDILPDGESEDGVITIVGKDNLIKFAILAEVGE